MTKKKYNLVFSSNLKNWSSNKKNILIGGWCLKKGINLKKFRFELNDIDHKLDKKNLMIKRKNERLYKLLINDVITNLKKILNLNLSKRGWEIFIGPWLMRYIQIFTNRFYILNEINKKYKSKKKNISFRLEKYDWDSFICKGSVDMQLKANEQEWNDRLFSYLWENYFLDKKIKDTKTKVLFTEKIRFKKYNFFSLVILNFLKKLERIVSFNNKYLFYRTYLANKFLLLKINLRLLNFPFIYFFEKKLSNQNKYLQVRKSNFVSSQRASKRNILGILQENFFRFLPKYYLENISELKYLEKVFPLPNIKKKLKIISGASFWRDNLFKFWLVKSISQGSKLYTLQHGCNYNATLYSSIEDFEIKHSDKFLSWGWSKKNVEPFYINKHINKKINNKKNDSILLVNSSAYEYSTGENTGRFYSYRSKLYLDVLRNLLTNTPNKIKKRLTIRGNAGENLRGTPITQTLKKEFKTFKFQDLNESFHDSLKNYGLIVNSYDSTPFLEAISLNKPTIMYIDNLIYKNRHCKSAKKYYDLLERNSIIHRSKNSLFKFLLKIDFDYLSWWNSKNVIQAKKTFCSFYARRSNNFEIKLVNFLKKKKI